MGRVFVRLNLETRKEREMATFLWSAENDATQIDVKQLQLVIENWRALSLRGSPSICSANLLAIV